MRSDDEQVNEIEDLRERLAAATKLLDATLYEPLFKGPLLAVIADWLRANAPAAPTWQADEGTPTGYHKGTFTAVAPTRTDHERAGLAESYAQFVFKQLGGWWMRNDPMKPNAANLLPPDVERRVAELARREAGSGA